MDALLKWIQTPEADKIAKVAEQKASKTFFAKYPNADKSKFEPQTDFAKDHTATSKIISKLALVIWWISPCYTANIGDRKLKVRWVLNNHQKGFCNSLHQVV